MQKNMIYYSYSIFLCNIDFYYEPGVQYSASCCDTLFCSPRPKGGIVDAMRLAAGRFITLDGLLHVLN